MRSTEDAQMREMFLHGVHDFQRLVRAGYFLGVQVDLQDTQQMARVRMVMEFLVERLQGLESVIEISGAL